MSSVTVINTTTGSVHVQETGRPGPAGLVWQDGGWLPDTRYQRNWALYHDGTSYRALVEHVASPETEPGVGADWETVWSVLALGSDVEDVETVAGIADEIVAVAAIKDEVVAVAEIDDDVSAVSTVAPQVASVSGIAADVTAVASIGAQVSSVATIDDDVTTVAGVADAVQVVASIKDDVTAVASIRDEVAIVAARDADIATVAARDADIGAVASNDANIGTVAANISDVTTAAQNIADIQAAPAAANAAQAWAEGTLPGGPGTKSAKEHAQDAANSASIASGATLVGYGVSIYNASGVEPGGYYADRLAANNSTMGRLYAEIISGAPGAEVDFYLEVGGEMAAGPFLVTQGAPVSLTGLDIEIGTDDSIGFVITSITGTVEFFAKTYGAVS